MGKLVVIYGDDPYLINEKLKKIETAMTSSERMVFDTQSSFQEIYQAVSSDSLFGAPRMILVKNSRLLTKKLAPSEETPFSEFLTLILDGPHDVIFLLNSALDKRLKQNKYLVKLAQCFEVKAFKEWEQGKIFQWIKTYLKEKNYPMIDQEALEALEFTGGTNLQQLASECDKLGLFCKDKGRITLNDVDIMCPGSAANVFRFNEAFAQGHAALCNRLCKDLLMKGEDEVRLFGLIAANVRFYLHLLAAKEAGHSAAQMANDLQKNAFYIQKIIAQISRTFSLNMLKAYLPFLAELDYKMKSGKLAVKQLPYLALSPLSQIKQKA